MTWIVLAGRFRFLLLLSFICATDPLSAAPSASARKSPPERSLPKNQADPKNKQNAPKKSSGKNGNLLKKTKVQDPALELENLKREIIILREKLLQEEEKSKRLVLEKKLLQMEEKASSQQLHFRALKENLQEELKRKRKNAALKRKKSAWERLNYTALKRSVFLPGYGQYSSGNKTRGIIYATSFAAFGLGALVSYDRYRRLEKRLEGASSWAPSAYESSWNDYQRERRRVNVFSAAALGIYIVNLFDAAFLTRFASARGASNTSALPFRSMRNGERRILFYPVRTRRAWGFALRVSF